MYLFPTHKQKSIYMIRSQPSSSTTKFFDQGQHQLPEELLTSMHTLLRHELNTIIGINSSSSEDNSLSSSFQYNARDLSILVVASLSEAIESYCGITNIHAPFFNLFHVMDNRIRTRRRELLVKHCRGYETIHDVVRDIETSRVHWLRDVMGNKAARNYEFGMVTTKVGNEHSHEKERIRRDGSATMRRKIFLNGLFP
jgi:vacuolar-type H+-ATPase catalytic subunit A/Vma1